MLEYASLSVKGLIL